MASAARIERGLQRPAQFGSSRVAQDGGKGEFGPGAALLCPLEQAPPVLGEFDCIAPAVPFRGPARDDSPVFERVEEGDNRGAVDAENGRDLLLRSRLAARDHSQHAEVAGGQAHVGERGVRSLLQYQVRVLEEVPEYVVMSADPIRGTGVRL